MITHSKMLRRTSGRITAETARIYGNLATMIAIARIIANVFFTIHAPTSAFLIPSLFNTLDSARELLIIIEIP